MRIEVTNLLNEEVEVYENVEDFLDDIGTEDMVYEWINQIGGSVEIPYLGAVSLGELFQALSGDYEVPYSMLREDWKDCELDFIESEILYSDDGTVNYGDYSIKGLDELAD